MAISKVRNQTSENFFRTRSLSSLPITADFSNTPTSTFTENGISYKALRFTSSGTLNITRAGIAEILVAAGGGGGGGQGGGWAGAGGGGGGLIVDEFNFDVGSYSVVVGGGGGAGGVQGRGGNGSDSRIVISTDQAITISTTGGGGGGGAPGNPGRSGGSAGGAATSGGLSGIPGQGSNSNQWSGGGKIDVPPSAFVGGPGLTSSFTGTSVEYSRGGGRTSGQVNGPANTGIGGNGRYTPATTGGSSGGSGIVIVRVMV